MGESNTVVSAYTLYRHLQQYCSHPSIRRCNPRGLEGLNHSDNNDFAFLIFNFIELLFRN